MGGGSPANSAGGRRLIKDLSYVTLVNYFLHHRNSCGDFWIWWNCRRCRVDRESPVLHFPRVVCFDISVWRKPVQEIGLTVTVVVG